MCPQPAAQELFLFSSPSTCSCPNLICPYFSLFMKCCIAWYRLEHTALRPEMLLLPQRHCPWRYPWGAGSWDTQRWWWKDLSVAAWGRQQQHASCRVALSLTVALKHCEIQVSVPFYTSLSLAIWCIHNRDHTKEQSPSRTDITFYINSIHMDFCIIDHFIEIC